MELLTAITRDSPMKPGRTRNKRLTSRNWNRRSLWIAAPKVISTRWIRETSETYLGAQGTFKGAMCAYVTRFRVADSQTNAPFIGRTCSGTLAVRISNRKVLSHCSVSLTTSSYQCVRPYCVGGNTLTPKRYRLELYSVHTFTRSRAPRPTHTGFDFFSKKTTHTQFRVLI